MLWEEIIRIFTIHKEAQPMGFLLALIISFLITPLIRERALKFGLVDRPDSCKDRTRIHKEAVPRLGGIAILISIVITSIIYLAIFGRYTTSHIDLIELEGIAAGGFIIFFLGLLDDIKPLNPFVKLGGQIIAASTAWLLGVRIELLANPLYYIDHAMKSTITYNDETSFIVTVIWLVAISNAINLIDGVDGLAVGVCLIASVATWAIAMSPTLNQPAGAIFAATLAGACLGFLRYNFNPARIFLGDNGAYLLGFILGCISCIGLVKKVTVVIISPILILILLVPIIDTIYAIFRRAVNKEAIMRPDLEHVHHKLLRLGLSQKQVTYLLYTVTFLGGLIGSWMLGLQIAVDYLLIASAVLAIGLFFTFVINYRKQKFAQKKEKQVFTSKPQTALHSD